MACRVSSDSWGQASMTWSNSGDKLAKNAMSGAMLLGVGAVFPVFFAVVRIPPGVVGRTSWLNAVKRTSLRRTVRPEYPDLAEVFRAEGKPHVRKTIRTQLSSAQRNRSRSTDFKGCGRRYLPLLRPMQAD